MGSMSRSNWSKPVNECIAIYTPVILLMATAELAKKDNGDKQDDGSLYLGFYWRFPSAKFVMMEHVQYY